MLRKITFAVLAISLCIAYYITFNARYIRVGTIVEIRKDAIVVQGKGPYASADALPIEEKSRFYNAQGDKIPLSGLKVGNRVKVKLFPRVYGRIFSAREQKSIRWVKVLSE